MDQQTQEPKRRGRPSKPGEPMSEVQARILYMVCKGALDKLKEQS